MPHAPPDEYTPRERLLDRGLVTLDGLYEFVRLGLPAFLRRYLDRLELERLRIDAFAKLVNAVMRKAVVSYKEISCG